MGDIARGWIVTRIPIAVVPVKITDNRIHKNCVLIRNMGPGHLYVFPNNNVTTLNGFPMCVGESLTIGLQDKSPEIPGWENIEVWGVSDTTAEVAVLAERI